MAEKTQDKNVATQERRSAVHAPRRKVYPRLDIFETENSYGVRAYVPGADRDSIQIDFHDGALTIQAEVQPREPEGVRYLLQEFRPADYFHRLQIGEGIDVDKVHAEYSEGVLTIDLPKAEAVKPRRIPIVR